MTEEKMLRFYEWEIKELGLEYPEHIPVWLFNRLNEAEPAPSKDWRPYCFYADNAGKCWHFKMAFPVACEKCPYRP